MYLSLRHNKSLFKLVLKTSIFFISKFFSPSTRIKSILSENFFIISLKLIFSFRKLLTMAYFFSLYNITSSDPDEICLKLSLPSLSISKLW